MDKAGNIIEGKHQEAGNLSKTVGNTPTHVSDASS